MSTADPVPTDRRAAAVIGALSLAGAALGLVAPACSGAAEMAGSADVAPIEAFELVIEDLVAVAPDGQRPYAWPRLQPDSPRVRLPPAVVERLEAAGLQTWRIDAGRQPDTTMAILGFWPTLVVGAERYEVRAEWYVPFDDHSAYSDDYLYLVRCAGAECRIEQRFKGHSDYGR